MMSRITTEDKYKSCNDKLNGVSLLLEDHLDAFSLVLKYFLFVVTFPKCR